MSQAVIPERVGVHPLVGWNPQYLRSWSEWKTSWNKTESLELRHGLLHVGFKVPAPSSVEVVERILFYLDIADGWADESHFDSGQERRFDTPDHHVTSLGLFHHSAGMRQAIATKAFQELCHHFFKSDSEFWRRIVDRPHVLEKVLWFFRSSEHSGLKNARDISEDKAGTVACDFARKFCSYVWHPAAYDDDRSLARRQIEPRRVLFANARPQLVRILYDLGQVRFLADTERFKPDARTLLALLRITMAQQYNFTRLAPVYSLSNFRRPQTLNEAVAVGSEPARVLMSLMIYMRERRRMRKIEAAKKARAAADHQLARANEGG